MKSYPYVPSMVQAITVLTVLKMMTKAQTTCGTGSNGKIMYERLPNVVLQGFDDDLVRDNGPPFMVLEKCQEMCLRDRTSNNLVRTCTSFDFQPGSRIASYNNGPEYDDSSCYLTADQAQPEGIGTLMLAPNSVHFTEVCITSVKPERECPNRKYIFERHPRKKLNLASDVKEMKASNRTECEDLCLNEFSFVCRSATFDSNKQTCTLSRFTRRTHPDLLIDDPDSDYLENTCLNAERRCDGLGVFIKEEQKRLGGPWEVDMFTNITLEDCQAMCVRAEKYFCRSFEYDEMTQQCTLSEEDSVSQKDDIGVASSSTHHFYDFVCLDSPRGSEYPVNPSVDHLFSGKKPDTAFQRYRNSRLSGIHRSELTGRSLSECLDECLRQPSFQCKSAEYSERYKSCRLSPKSQADGGRIIYDADYDYYENLMLGGEYETNGPRPRPGNNRHPEPGKNKYPPEGPNNKYPPRPTGGDYPERPYRYPGDDDRFPNGGRYPYDRDPLDYNDQDRYGGGGYDGGSRYPPTGRPDRYPDHDDRYPDDPYALRPIPPSSNGGYRGRDPDKRYPPTYNYDYRYGGSDRYGDDRRYNSIGYGSRYDERYGGVGGRYGSDGGRYGSDGGRYGGAGGRYGSDGGRYGGEGGRYGTDGGRYGGEGGRYGGAGGRYGSEGGRYGGDGGRYGSEGGRYGGDGGRYGGAGGRYGSEGGRYGGVGGRYGGERDRYGDEEFKYRSRFGPGGGRFEEGGRYGGGYRGDRYPPYRDRLDSSKYDYYGDDRNGGSRWFFRPDRRPGRPIDPMPYDDRPPSPNRRPFSPGPDGPIYDNFDSNGPHRPYASRCDDADNFKQMGSRQRARKEFIRKSLHASSLNQCQRECIEARDFTCRSFNYRDAPPGYESERERENCELSDRDSRDLEVSNPQYFDTTGNYDFYERSMGRQGVDGDCLDVSQICNEDGMEFTLRTPEPFWGRIYTYGFYDRCYFRGNGGTVNVLRISGAGAYPECGTQRYGDTMTNIVVVQFSDYVQTGKDKRFNLTCLFRGPGEAIVSSGFIGAGSGSPIPIEYLPAENTLSSKVRLMILYQGRPTTTIAVGDPLTFRLESQDGYNYVTDIFATNVVARDPYSGRSVQLIDRVGCPVDSYVFPELDKGRNGDSLEARFNAFKIPESNFLVFEATVRTCRDGCQPAYCQSGTGRSEPSFGRRKRDINGTLTIEGNNTLSIDEGNISESNETTVSFPETVESIIKVKSTEKNSEESESPEFVREMIKVLDSREEVEQEARTSLPETVCLTPGEYHGLVSAILILIAILLTMALISGLAYRRYWLVMRKNVLADRTSSNFSTSSYPNTRSSGLSTGISIFGNGIPKPFSGFSNSRNFVSMSKEDVECPSPAPGGPFEDPSEPIYTDPSLFERSRSLRSIAVSPKRRISPGPKH